MAIKSTAVTVTTSATRLDTDAETDRIPISAVAVYNNGSVTVYLGGSDVTTSNGVPMAAASWGPALSGVDTGEALYGIVASGTADVRVLEQGI